MRFVDNADHKRKMQAMFDAMRNFSHESRLGKLGGEEVTFRSELESKILI